MVSSADVGERIKAIIRRDLKLGQDIPLEDSTPFFGTEADIDSLDILLLLTSIEKEFAVKVPSEKVGREIFENVGTLVRFVEGQKNGTSSAANSSSTAAMPAEDYLSRLPHGPEFRFVTKVTQVQPGVSSEGMWEVSGSEPFFAGHFPGNPIVPGVLLAESLAQVAGFALPITVGQTNVQARLAHVDVRFEQAVKPPAKIVLIGKWVRAMGTVHQFEVEASVGGAAVARGTISLSCGPTVV